MKSMFCGFFPTRGMDAETPSSNVEVKEVKEPKRMDAEPKTESGFLARRN